MNILNNHDICKDSFKNIYSIDDYMAHYKNGNKFTPLCPTCNKILFARCKDNPSRRTHFAHYKNQSCSLINYTKRFEKANISPPSKQEIEIVRFYSFFTHIEFFSKLNLF